jgi:hypothetical protein
MKGLILLNTAEFTFLHKADRHTSRKVRFERGADIPVNFTDYGLSYDHFSFVEVIA